MNYNNYYQYLQPNVILIQSEQDISMYRLAPNASYIFMRNDEQIAYYVTTDAVGKATMQVLDYTIRPDAKTAKQEAEMNELRQRLASIESLLGGLVHESTVSTAEQQS